MRNYCRAWLPVTTTTVLLVLAGCNGVEGEGASGAREVETTGKQDTALQAVPAEVLAAALAARPGLEITAAEHERRDGREYYDLGGTLEDGSELELDLTRVDGRWTVVEVQRDLPMSRVPEPVQPPSRPRRAGGNRLGSSRATRARA